MSSINKLLYTKGIDFSVYSAQIFSEIPHNL